MNILCCPSELSKCSYYRKKSSNFELSAETGYVRFHVSLQPPDLTPSNFDLFSELKVFQVTRKIKEDEEVIEEVEQDFDYLDADIKLV